MLNHLSQNPLRVPQWRWLRAEQTAKGELPTTPRLDGGNASSTCIAAAAKFYTAYHRCHEDQSLQMELALDHPDMFWAHNIYSDPLHPAKWALEAHLLARETDEEIAFRIGCASNIVACYENVFFNVREKLSHKEYVLNVILSQSITRGLRERDHDLLWKLYGYIHGPHMLDALIGRISNPQWVTRPDDVSACFQDDAIALMKKKAALAALTVPINGQTHLNLIEAFVKYVEIERSTDSAGQASDQIQQNIDSMLQSLPFDVGEITTEADVAKHGNMADFDQGAVELRGDEMMCVAAGYSLPGESFFKKVVFPERPVTYEPINQDS